MRNFILYGLASAFNRGGIFLILPLLAALLSVADYGNFNLYMTIVQLLVPIISLNISLLVGREIYEKHVVAKSFVVIFNKFSALIIIFFLSLSFFIENIIFFILIYAFLEAIFLVNSTYVRFKYGSDHFFWVCFLKILILTFSLGYFFIFDRQIIMSIKNLIIIFSVSNLSIIYYFIKLFFTSSFKRMFVIISGYKGMLLFSIGLLPHTLSQWVSSSSDRFLVKFYTNDIELGYYSFSYSLAAIFMIVNSSLALGIPQLCVKNFIFFKSNKFYSIFFLLVSLLWVSFLGIYIAVLYFFSDKYDVKYIFKIGYVILVGMYFLSFYYYYSSFLFYDRESKRLSYITFFVAVINVFLVMLLTPLFGILGTAFSTLISYLIYVLMSYRCVRVSYAVANLYAPISFILIVSTCLFVFLFFFKIGGVSYV